MTLKYNKVKREAFDSEEEDDKVHKWAKTFTPKIESSDDQVSDIEADDPVSRIESKKDASSSRQGRKGKEKASSWSREEDLRLIDLRDNQKLPWKEVAAYFPGRTVIACQHHLADAQRNVTDEQDLDEADKKSVDALYKKRKMAIFKQLADEVNNSKICSRKITWKTAQVTVEERIRRGK